MNRMITPAMFAFIAALLVIPSALASDAVRSDETDIVRVEKHPTNQKLSYLTFRFSEQKKKMTVEAWALPSTTSRPYVNTSRLYIRDVTIPPELGGLPDGKPCHLKIYDVPHTLAVGIAQYLTCGKNHEFIVWIRRTVDLHPKDTPQFPRRKGYFEGVSFHTPYTSEGPDWLGDSRHERFH